MIDYKEAYSIFRRDVSDETLLSMCEVEDAFQFVTKEQNDGVYVVSKKDGSIMLLPFWKLLLEPPKVVKEIDLNFDYEEQKAS